MKDRTKRARNQSTRVKKIQKIVKEWRDTVAPMLSSDEIPIKPHRVIKEIRDFLDKDAILVTDSAYSTIWGGVHYDALATGRVFIASRGFGGLGFGLPASIGAKLAATEKQVLCIAGDGGFSEGIQELETALRHDVKVVVVVLNNRTLNFERQIMKYYFGKWYATDLLDVNFGKVAEAFGCFGIRVERPGEIKDALKNAFNSGKPGVIDVVIDPDVVPPTTFYDPFVIAY